MLEELLSEKTTKKVDNQERPLNPLKQLTDRYGWTPGQVAKLAKHYTRFPKEIQEILLPGDTDAIVQQRPAADLLSYLDFPWYSQTTWFSPVTSSLLELQRSSTATDVSPSLDKDLLNKINSLLHNKLEPYMDTFSDLECPIPRINVKDLTRENFQTWFVDLNYPVIITGLMENSEHWEDLAKLWTKPYFLKNFGSTEALVGTIPYGQVFGEFFARLTIEKFLTRMEKDTRDLWNSDAPLSKFPLYIFDPELSSKILKEKWKIPELFDETIVNSERYWQFMMGPVFSGAPFHYHCDAVNVIVHGTKLWWLRPPSDAIYSKLHPLLHWQKEINNSANMTAASSTTYQCLQRAGETIYVPRMWSHSVLNLEDTIALAIEFDTHDC